MGIGEIFFSTLFNDSNAKAYYRLENGALTTDSKGSYTLTNTGTVTATSAKYGYGASFGTDKRLSTANHIISAIPTNYGVSFWYKSGSTSQRGTLLIIGDTGTNGFFITQSNSDLTGNGNELNVIFSGSTVWRTGVTVGDTSNFHHVVFTRGASGNSKFYHDKTLYQTGTTFINLTSSVFALGSNPDATPFYFNGVMDDVFVIQREITAAEVTSIYDATLSSRFNVGSPMFFSQGLAIG